MFDHKFHIQHHNFNLKHLVFVMGQLIDYLTNIIGGRRLESSNHSGHHVTFSDLSIASAFSRGDSDRQAMAEQVNLKNKRTIMIYEAVGVVAVLLNFFLVAWPKIRTDEFNVFQPEGWQLLILTWIPLVFYWASFGAMIQVSKPLAQGAKFTDKNVGLDLNKNDFIHSIKVMTLLVAFCQISAIFSDQLLWSVLVIVPLWCLQLTARLSKQEFDRYAPGPKRNSWTKLNVVRSPVKSASPSPTKSRIQTQPKLRASPNGKAASSASAATPRTRTKRAVRNIITGVTDKYHAFEQEVAHQINTKIFVPLSPKKVAIE